jgi:hypothetical protein
MTRDEHLAWSKERALEYLNRGDLTNAFASMTSDLGKHPELANHSGLMMGAMLLVNGHLSNPEDMRRWIVGFN